MIGHRAMLLPRFDLPGFTHARAVSASTRDRSSTQDFSCLSRPSTLGGPRRRWSGACRSSCPATGPKAAAGTGLWGPSLWGVGQSDALCNRKSTMTENNKHWAGRETFFLATAPLVEKCFTHSPPPTVAAMGGEMPAQGVPLLLPSHSRYPSLAPPQEPLLRSPRLEHGRPKAPARRTGWASSGHVEIIATLLHSPQ